MQLNVFLKGGECGFRPILRILSRLAKVEAISF
jgi:hypothetical protein